MLDNTVRPALKAVQTVGEVSLRTGASQTRCFSASASRQRKRVLSFPKADNPALNETLDQVHKKIVLPAQLPLHQRKKIFRGRWKAKLEQEPLQVQIGDMNVRFRHIDGTKGEIPGARRVLWKAMSQMETKTDWQVLPKLMAALSYARKLKDDTWNAMIRKAGDAGNLGPLFELAKRPLDDGLQLNTHEKAQNFMTAVAREVAMAGWTERAAAKGLRNAETVLRHLNEEEHKPERGYSCRMAKDPQFLAMPVTMAAVLVAQYGKRSEHFDTLVKYTQAMLRKWPEGKGLLTVHPDEEYIKGGSTAYMMDKSHFLAIAAPIVKGLEWAEKGLGDDLKAQVASRRAIVAEEMDSAVAWLRQREAQGGRPFSSTRGGSLYEACFRRLPVGSKNTKTEAVETTA